MMNRPAAAEGSVPDSGSLPVRARAPAMPATATPSNPLPSSSTRTEAIDVVDLTTLSNIWKPPANARNASNQVVGDQGSEGGKSAAGDRWTKESLAFMLETILRHRLKYDNGAGGFKQAIWPVIEAECGRKGMGEALNRYRISIRSLRSAGMIGWRY